ncbi:cytochrome c oxidase subunit 3 [Noviherbaspirillum pedocola]|uniref:Heme-copper oxidase subunit III n=1 Tax=Noviherbaspirillum pedocola TaxID=2801341 RepID=A0A934SVM9_9BURK|nr:cytochrome c oxidase subunit 3 [Noviherbaspirillum pedocola]MBK4736597.1 heme-copper oxidase subunit III [Noviherbaspirillum pedocola]
MNDIVGMPGRPLPVGSVGHRASGWWGMWTVIATEASLFAYLLFSYAYLASQAHGGFVPEAPKFRLAGPNTVLLIASSFVLYWGESGIKKGKRGRLMAALALTFVMGAAFVGIQLIEWKGKTYGPSTDAYASSYFITTGFHMAHVVGGLLVIAVLFLWAAIGKFSHERHAAVSIGALYWHFVDVVWLAVFATFYVSPYLTGHYG